MFGMTENVYFEGIFVRWDGELEPILENVLMIRSTSTEQIINKISESINIDGKIQIYKYYGNNTDSRIHKVVEVYNDLEPACN